ncbi:MAG: hypothetical protein WCX95_01085 [Candidatus Gracilibacteria bacterium]
MGLEAEPKEWEKDAEAVSDGDKNVDGHEIAKADPAKEIVGDGFLAKVGADAGKKGAEMVQSKERETQERIEAEARMAALDQKLDGVVASKGEVPTATTEVSKPAETEVVAQNEIADKQEEIAKRSGALIGEGKDESEA